MKNHQLINEFEMKSMLDAIPNLVTLRQNTEGMFGCDPGRHESQPPTSELVAASDTYASA
jgi:hypothetical protein